MSTRSVLQRDVETKASSYRWGNNSFHFIYISGVVMSPNFPNIYPNNIDRTDMIYVAPEKKIEIVFTNFTVQLHPSCRHDQLSIIDQDGSELLGLSCGLELPPGESPCLA